MNGGEADAQTALNALNELQSKTSEIGLETNFADVFDYENKANKEIILLYIMIIRSHFYSMEDGETTWFLNKTH